MSPPSPYRPTHNLAAAQPRRRIFDSWNSSSTGHQRADNNLSGSTSWRESRSRKLEAQFGDTTGAGGKRLYDTVGAGSEDFGKDGRKDNGSWAKGAKGLRSSAQLGAIESFGRSRGSGSCEEEDKDHGKTRQPVPSAGNIEKSTRRIKVDEEESSDQAPMPTLESQPLRPQNDPARPAPPQPKQHYPQFLIGLTFYINGSTYPLISDHKLKQLISQHGGRLSIHLGRNTVTHVIIGTPGGHGSKIDSGAGGGLAGSKIQKEIAKVRGKGVKFVQVAWLVESIKAGRRLPEAGFVGLKLAAKGQGSVYGMFGGKVIEKDSEEAEKKDSRVND